MRKTIIHLENKKFFKRVRASTAIADMFLETTEGKKLSEKVKREAYKDLIMRELANDKALLDAVLDDITDGIIKHI